MADVTLLESLKNSYFQEEACSSDTLSSYRVTRGIWAGTTEWSNVVIAESPEYGRVLFLDKELQSAESDERIYHEHLVHPILNALSHVPNKRVLIVGGGEGATAREVLKYSKESVSQVVWIDIDNSLVELCRRHLSWADDDVYNDPRLMFLSMDIRVFLEGNMTTFDVILLDLPDPDVDALTNFPNNTTQLYGEAFWVSLRANLRPGGAIATHAGPIAPGSDGSKHREGLTWIQTIAEKVLGSKGMAYHVNIPSFQSEWGFWMSVRPKGEGQFPDHLAVMDLETQTLAFTWPKYWFSPYIGNH